MKEIKEENKQAAKSKPLNRSLSVADKELIFFIYQAGLMANVDIENRDYVENWILTTPAVKKYFLNLPIIKELFIEQINYELNVYNTDISQPILN